MRFCFSCLPMRCRIVRKHNFFIVASRFRRVFAAVSARFFIERGRAGIRQRRVMGAKRRAAERESRATSKI